MNSYKFVKSDEMCRFKAKDCEKNASQNACSGNFSKTVSVDNMKNSELYGCVYGFSVDYDSINIDGILDIQKCFMRGYNIK